MDEGDHLDKEHMQKTQRWERASSTKKAANRFTHLEHRCGKWRVRAKEEHNEVEILKSPRFGATSCYA